MSRIMRRVSVSPNDNAERKASWNDYALRKVQFLLSNFPHQVHSPRKKKRRYYKPLR
jgi:hypothetical protein